MEQDTFDASSMTQSDAVAFVSHLSHGPYTSHPDIVAAMQTALDMRDNEIAALKQQLEAERAKHAPSDNAAFYAFLVDVDTLRRLLMEAQGNPAAIRAVITLTVNTLNEYKATLQERAS
jgi:DNA-binding GntR family transcriptional regulator